MKRTYAWRNGQLVELTESVPERFTEIMNDTGEFVSSSGKHITSRSGWRDHLKETGSIEMGHGDIQKSQENWQKRKAAFRERLKGEGVREVEAPSGEIRPLDRSRINAEVRNHLEGRPIPDRKTLLKLTLDIARDLERKR